MDEAPSRKNWDLGGTLGELIQLHNFVEGVAKPHKGGMGPGMNGIVGLLHHPDNYDKFVRELKVGVVQRNCDKNNV